MAIIVLGMALILLNYLVPTLIPGGNFNLIIGFVLMAIGLAVLSQWR